MRQLYLTILFLLVVSLCCGGLRAQYVTLSPGMKQALQAQFPSCFNSVGQLDTSCAAIVNATSLTLFGIDSTGGIEYFKNLSQLDMQASVSTRIPKLPQTLTYLKIQSFSRLQQIDGPFPSNLNYLEVSYCDSLSSVPLIPNGVQYLYLDHNKLAGIPNVPNSLSSGRLNNNRLTSLPSFSGTFGIQQLNLDYNMLSTLPADMPDQFSTISCSNNKLTALPRLPAYLDYLKCDNNLLTVLPRLPQYLTLLNISRNGITCLPVLPNTLAGLWIDTNYVKCIPNWPATLKVYHDTLTSLLTNVELCNPTNNVYGCTAFPVMKGRAFFDKNNNGVRDANETLWSNLKLLLSNGDYTFTSDSGAYQLTSDTIGNFTVTPVPLPFFNAVPGLFAYSFTTNDTLVTKDIAIQRTVVKDSVQLQITAFSLRRPGASIKYQVGYRNVGSTDLSQLGIALQYDANLLTYNSASTAAVTQAGNTITFNRSLLPIGDNGVFYLDFTIKTTAAIGDVIALNGTLNTSTVSAADTSRTMVRASYDPNDKNATPRLSPEQINNNARINYVIRFQNTGNDTAFNVVIADTLSALLQPGTLEVLASSHPCQTTVNGKFVFFEFRNIMLPDSNVNEPGSHGFIALRVKPVTGLVNGNVVPNKAAIYFDYNPPVITNTATTNIVSTTLPLKLLAFSASPDAENNVRLLWTVANEVNTNSFIVEQSSDGRRFAAIGTVRAAGTGNNSYTFTDRSPVNGVRYYRLKMLDNDGMFSYSNIVQIKLAAAGSFSLTNNPVRTVLSIAANRPSLMNTEATIVNSVGVVIKRFVIKSTVQSVNVASLPAGVYVLHTQQGNEKFVKE